MTYVIIISVFLGLILQRFLMEYFQLPGDDKERKYLLPSYFKLPGLVLLIVLVFTPYEFQVLGYRFDEKLRMIMVAISLIAVAGSGDKTSSQQSRKIKLTAFLSSLIVTIPMISILIIINSAVISIYNIIQYMSALLFIFAVVTILSEENIKSLNKR